MADSYPRSRRDLEENDPFRVDYRPGYEPSAPPYYYSAPPQGRSPNGAAATNDLDEFPHSKHREHYLREPREPVLGHPEPNETLGGYLVSRLLGPVWRVSHTVVRIDLRRSLQYNGPLLGKGRHGSAPAGTVASSGGADYAADEETHALRGWFNGISGGGARLKLMQIWDVPEKFLGDSRRHWNINMGFGLNVELDKGLLQPKLRLKARHVALRLLPQPEIELRGKWPLGGSRLAINAKYRIPLTMGLEDFWTSSGARLMVNFYNPLGTGFHLTPGGVEFDEHLISLGEHTKLRFAAALEFPRRLPLEEGEQPVKVRVHRLGLKTVIKPGVTV